MAWQELAFASFCPSRLPLLDSFSAATLPMRIYSAHHKHEVLAMHHLYDNTASKKATNLSINSDLLAKARTLNINLSATLEHALEEEVRKAEQANWRENNKKAIDELNKLADEHGLFSDAYRDF
ncbi:MAG: type II toxin-antitoxin system CcdA family antitoxin [bacterium]